MTIAHGVATFCVTDFPKVNLPQEISMDTVGKKEQKSSP